MRQVLRARHMLVFFRWKLGQQVRPLTRDDPADFGIDGGDDLETFLDLPADHLKVLRAQGPAVQEFHRHSFAPPRGRRHRVQPGEHGHRRVALAPRTPESEHKASHARERVTVKRPDVDRPAGPASWTINVQPRRSGHGGAPNCRGPQY